MSIVLHLPKPPSVNDANNFGVNPRSGKVQHYPSKDKERFFKEADGLYMTQKRALMGQKISGPFTYHIILNRDWRGPLHDGSNHHDKYVLDFAQRIGLIENDKLAEGGSWSWGFCEHGAMLSIHPVAVCVPDSKTGDVNERVYRR